MLVHSRPNTPSTSTSTTTTTTFNSSCKDCSFEHFFEVWLLKLRSYMNQLLFLSSSQNNSLPEDELTSLVAEVLSHYQSYYNAKSREAQWDVFLLFSPSWFTSYERTFLWITGFKPASMFNILDKCTGRELSMEQIEEVQKVKLETRAMEKVLSDQMIEIEESIAERKLVQVLMEGQVIHGDLDHVVKMIKDQLRNLVINADFLRTRTATKIVEILSSVQAAKFLAATARFQLKIRALALQRDADRMMSI